MTPAQSIALACAVLAALSFLVAMRLFLVRVGEMRAKRIRPEQIATSLQMAGQLQFVQASDNFKNLFELPVLFYALCALLIATGNQSTAFAYGAWLFVGTRYVHSLIHCTYNNVLHRLAAYASGVFVLLTLWICFALKLLEQ